MSFDASHFETYKEAFKRTLASSHTLGEELEARISTLQPLHLSDEYIQAPLKVMIMGQETYGAYDPIKQVARGSNDWDDIEFKRAFDAADDFDYAYGKSQASSRWWRAYQEICDHFGLPSRRATAWTNISKVQLWDDNASVSMTSLTAEEQMKILAWQRQLILAEVNYAKPDIIIMLTGGLSWMARHIFADAQTGKLAAEVPIDGAPKNTRILLSPVLGKTVAGFTLHPAARKSDAELRPLRSLLINALESARTTG